LLKCSGSFWMKLHCCSCWGTAAELFTTACYHQHWLDIIGLDLTTALLPAHMQQYASRPQKHPSELMALSVLGSWVQLQMW
jgi:hypothetical protein